jgi:predicted lipoprotein with Yx(FWY)xxD motif
MKTPASFGYAFVASLLTLSACDNTDDTPPAPQFDVATATTPLGTVLTGEGGRTLYFFTKDVAGISACEGNCLTNWPVFYKESPNLGQGLAIADFATITRADGTKQNTFRGWPLYYFKNDAAAGETKGENVGGVWYVARPRFSVMLASTQLKGNNGKNYVVSSTGAYTEGTGETTYLVDSLGRTLYAFAPDKNLKNTYTKQDFSNNATWPLAEFGATNIPSSLNAADFSTLTVFGRKQLTYKGWPLYYFGQDGGVRGANKGVSVPQPGVWPIVNASTPVAPQ